MAWCSNRCSERRCPGRRIAVYHNLPRPVISVKIEDFNTASPKQRKMAIKMKANPSKHNMCRQQLCRMPLPPTNITLTPQLSSTSFSSFHPPMSYSRFSPLHIFFLPSFLPLSPTTRSSWAQVDRPHRQTAKLDSHWPFLCWMIARNIMDGSPSNSNIWFINTRTTGTEGRGVCNCPEGLGDLQCLRDKDEGSGKSSWIVSALTLLLQLNVRFLVCGGGGWGRLQKESRRASFE